MSILGVNVICAAVSLAAVGNIRRLHGSRPVVAYLSHDPCVYQSGSGNAQSGRILTPQGRSALVEAASFDRPATRPAARLL